ncbi:MAG: hypothetical protein IT497_04000 [Ottowia sp.]|nr:hypothetical protein [Ottowia sp.]
MPIIYARRSLTKNGHIAKENIVPSSIPNTMRALEESAIIKALVRGRRAVCVY